MKILIISPYPPFPLSWGGKIRTFEIAKGLAMQKLDVSIVAPYKIGQNLGSGMHDGVNIHYVKYPFFIPHIFGDRLFPFQFLVSFHPGYRLFIKQYLTSFDIYQFEHASFADLIDHIPPGKTVIYNAHNVEYDYVKSECRNSMVEKLSTQRIFNFEKKLISRANTIFACSKEDKERIIELYDAGEKKILIIPNGIYKNSSIRYNKNSNVISSLPALMRYKKRVVFNGSDVEHNRVAVKFIIEELAPTINSDCVFIIVGSCGKSFKKIKMGNVFIDTRGELANEYIKIATIGINPVTQGGGTSLKVLEYVYSGLPIISTRFGIRGYSDLEPFANICDLNEFTSAIRDGVQPLTAATADILKRYLWPNIAKKIKDIYYEQNKK